VVTSVWARCKTSRYTVINVKERREQREGGLASSMLAVHTPVW